MLSQLLLQHTKIDQYAREKDCGYPYFLATTRPTSSWTQFKSSTSSDKGGKRKAEMSIPEMNNCHFSLKNLRKKTVFKIKLFWSRKY